VVAPEKELNICNKGGSLYLTAETLSVIRDRDSIKGKAYHKLRNMATRLVRRDKRACNAATLAPLKGDPCVLWNLASAALGKDRPTLPASLKDSNGHPTYGNVGEAEVMNSFYISEVKRLRAASGVDDSPVPPLKPLLLTQPGSNEPRKLAFSFARATKVMKVVKNLYSTEAIGVDGVLTSVLKKGIAVLTSPIAYLVNRSLAYGVVPYGFKTGVVVPVFTSKGKERTDPASYRPFSILPALSKVLEVIVKQDLEKHLTVVNGLSGNQNG
jgi:hypothetical protein